MSRNNNRADSAPSDKKVWQTIHFAPCPFRKNHLYCLQQLLGAHVWDDELGKQVFQDVEEFPRATRTVLMEMDNTGFMRNVNSGGGYNGPRNY